MTRTPLKTPQAEANRSAEAETKTSKQIKRIADSLQTYGAHYKSSDNDATQHNREVLLWTKRAAVGAIIYTIITGIILGASIRSIQESRRSTHYAVESAKAANRQADISSDTEKRQLRAYVGATPGDIANFGEDDQTIVFTRRNFGLTPAYDLGFSVVGFGIYPANNPVINVAIPQEPCVFNRNNSPTGLITLFPGAIPMKIILKEAKPNTGIITTEQVKAVVSGSMVFAYFGTICYRDTFGAQHFTRYCWMYKGKKMTTADADGCLNYNDSN